MFGESGGISQNSMPSSFKTSLKPLVNLASRSKVMCVEKHFPCSAKNIDKLRSCCLVHKASGLGVMSAICTCRVSICTKENT
jgi:hypothetical protein